MINTTKSTPAIQIYVDDTTLVPNISQYWVPVFNRWTPETGDVFYPAVNCTELY
jgi:hypothetical protein